MKIGDITVKIILSRKGFDSENGGYASPILPDGEMLSLPIPSSLDDLTYREIDAPGGKNYEQIIEELGVEAYIGGQGAHLDPDLAKSVRPRRPGWLPAFGQNDKAGGHLRNQEVSEGDLFLFFGRFCHTVEVDGRLQFCGHEMGFHAIFGYMEIGKRICADEDAEFPSWLHDHPHTMPAHTKYINNTIYVAKPKLSLHPNYLGGGVFQFDERHRLTKKGARLISHWNLDPKIFRHLTISYHPNKEEVWKEEYFQSRSRGQEFVIQADEGVKQWASNLIKGSRLWSN
jgi:hypothetical protein